MLGARSLLLLAGCFLVASAVWADDVGYVDCGAHPEGLTVYGKARRSQDIVGTLPCGERFTILLYGFVFSRIETSDNKIGYVFSSLINVDRSVTAVLRSASGLVAPAPPPKLPAAAAPAPGPPAPTQSTPTTLPSAPGESTQVQAAPAQPKPEDAPPAPAESAATEVTPRTSATSPAAASRVAAAITTGDPNPQPALAPQQPASAQPNSAPTATSSSAEGSSIAPTPGAEARGAESTPDAQPNPSSAAEPAAVPVSSPSAPEPSAAMAPGSQPGAVRPTPAPAAPESTPTTAADPGREARAAESAPAAPSSPLPTPTPAVSEESAPATPSDPPAALRPTAIREPAAPVAPPDPPVSSPPAPPAAQPSASQPPSSQPKAAPPRAREASMRSSWERPHPTGRRQSLLELYGGYAYARFDNGTGSFFNLNGAVGACGVNIVSWLQLVGDTSYNLVTASGLKTQLYGNHYGPRLFYRRRSRSIATPFAEALFGGTRLTTSVSGTSGSTSDNEFSMKIGGGIDLRPSRHIEFRLLDVDYYRTSFGTNLHQNNYWATTGIVLRFFGGRAE